MTNGTGRRGTPAARTGRRAPGSHGDDAGARDARLVIAAREREDRDALEALVSEHLGLVERIARLNARHADQVDDLVQEGVVGLLKAIRRYEPGRGVPFQAYARAVVTGEILHHLRDRSSSLRLPEPVRELRTRLRRLAEGTQAQTGREPGIAELAALAGVSEESAAEAATAGVSPLDGDLPAPGMELGSCEERVELEAHLGRLDRREREVVLYRYFADLTQHEIGERLARHLADARLPAAARRPREDA